MLQGVHATVCMLDLWMVLQAVVPLSLVLYGYNDTLKLTRCCQDGVMLLANTLLLPKAPGVMMIFVLTWQSMHV